MNVQTDKDGPVISRPHFRQTEIFFLQAAKCQISFWPSSSPADNQYILKLVGHSLIFSFSISSTLDPYDWVGQSEFRTSVAWRLVPDSSTSIIYLSFGNFFLFFLLLSQSPMCYYHTGNLKGSVVGKVLSWFTFQSVAQFSSQLPMKVYAFAGVMVGVCIGGAT